MTMRPAVRCPACGRRGRYQRRMGHQITVTHTCPGPWTLEGVEDLPGDINAPARIRFHPGDSAERKEKLDRALRALTSTEEVEGQ